MKPLKNHHRLQQKMLQKTLRPMRLLQLSTVVNFQMEVHIICREAIGRSHGRLGFPLFKKNRN